MAKYLDQTGLKYFWGKIKGKFIKKSDALSYEEIQASTNLKEKIGSAEALKKVIVKESVYTKVRTDSAGKFYPGLETAKLFLLSAKANDYVVDTSITSSGNTYFFIVKTSDGAIIRNTNISAIYVNYVER